MNNFLKENIPYFVVIIALLATAGSLFFGFHGIPICALCWYQRIFMYPLAFIILVGIVRKDRDLPWYVLPLSIPGMLIASYHVALQSGWVSERVEFCTVGVSCTTKYAEWLGFITIPLLSFLAFAVLTAAFLFLVINSQKS